MKSTSKLPFAKRLTVPIACLTTALACLIPGADIRAQATIVDVAVGNPNFSTLVTAVQAAGLAETLSGPGPFTVFAPNNAAFTKRRDARDC